MFWSLSCAWGRYTNNNNYICFNFFFKRFYYGRFRNLIIVSTAIISLASILTRIIDQTIYYLFEKRLHHVPSRHRVKYTYCIIAYAAILNAWRSTWSSPFGFFFFLNIILRRRTQSRAKLCFCFNVAKYNNYYSSSFRNILLRAKSDLVFL